MFLYNKRYYRTILSALSAHYGGSTLNKGTFSIL